MMNIFNGNKSKQKRNKEKTRTYFKLFLVTTVGENLANYNTYTIYDDLVYNPRATINHYNQKTIFSGAR